MKRFLVPWLRSRGWVARRFLIPDGGILPRWFGIALWDPIERRALVLPIPLNVVVGALARVRDALKTGVSPGWHEREVEEAYRRGRRDALKAP